MPPRHVSVLPREVVQFLDPQPGKILIDATLGAGGHARLLAENGAAVIALDHDPAMIALARPRLDGLPVECVHAGFDQLRDVLNRRNIVAVDGVLADLGVCSDQLDDAGRGFSFQTDGPLDMRLDPTRGVPAARLVRDVSERELADLIFRYGEERFSRRIARTIVAERAAEPIETTARLAAIVRRCVPRSRGIDPATRTFQALRIAVNEELDALAELLRQLPGCVKPGGRAVLISFHSLEDRLVKQAFRDGDAWRPLTKKPVTANDDEQRTNPRSRSAKLRAAERVRREASP